VMPAGKIGEREEAGWRRRPSASRPEPALE
jgi:hypothetical protein